MAAHLPTLVVTGASGIVGRGFPEAARERYPIYAIARRVTAQSAPDLSTGSARRVP